jgi:4-deoxy-L-threo-5-hexosulose-uronate ketol-isomerase
MRILHAVHPDDFKRYDTETIRRRFLIDELFNPGAIRFTYTHYDRMMVGGIQPGNEALLLETYPLLRSAYFLERRELGLINVGGPVRIDADNKTYQLEKLDCLYIGMGTRQVTFTAEEGENPPLLYALSAPAHSSHPTALLKKVEAESTILGDPLTSNRRSIHRYIHLNGIQSCQLVMGLTLLEPGSVWNTIPPHVHDRRMEAYFYFDLAGDQRVFHYMGEPSETRHLLVKNHEAVVSPPWSIHSGGGTGSYGFIWGMAGENKEYSDMDGIQLSELR